MTWFKRQRDAIITAIVTDLLPAHPALDARARSTVAADVVGFVVAQVQGLPEFLRLPYGAASFAFDGLAILRWGRPFRMLDAGRRRAYVALWSESPLGAARSFVKLVRSCTLLAYYDHPAVRARLEASAAPSGEAAAGLRSHAGSA
jgi:hypothetical protein